MIILDHPFSNNPTSSESSTVAASAISSSSGSGDGGRVARDSGIEATEFGVAGAGPPRRACDVAAATATGC